MKMTREKDCKIKMWNMCRYIFIIVTLLILGQANIVIATEDEEQLKNDIYTFVNNYFNSKSELVYKYEIKNVDGESEYLYAASMPKPVEIRNSDGTIKRFEQNFGGSGYVYKILDAEGKVVKQVPFSVGALISNTRTPLTSEDLSAGGDSSVLATALDGRFK